ncbi:MAG: hypothetical protein ACK5QX_08050, partial [bacterium]
MDVVLEHAAEHVLTKGVEQPGGRLGADGGDLRDRVVQDLASRLWRRARAYQGPQRTAAGAAAHLPVVQLQLGLARGECPIDTVGVGHRDRREAVAAGSHLAVQRLLAGVTRQVGQLALRVDRRPVEAHAHAHT